MPGVLRPYTLVDVIATLNQQNGQNNGAQLINGLGDFAEVDESVTVTDGAFATANLNPGWDQGQWNSVLWS